MRRPLLSLIAIAVLAVACSGGGDNDDASVSSSVEGATTTQVANPGNPGTLLPPTTTTIAPEFLLPVAPTVAFLDACIADISLVGPCHCASSRLEAGFSEGDIVVFEDRLRGLNDFSPEVAAALVDCREATPPAPWSDETVDRYVAGCIKGADRLLDLCRCSARRAQDVIPEVRVDDYLAADDVTPSLVDLINTCI